MEKEIIKYLQNEISQKDFQELCLWVQVPENEEEFKKIVREQSLLNQAFTDVDTAAAHRQLLDRINDEDQKKGKVISFSGWLKYAAVFIGIIGLGYGLFSDKIFENNKIKEQTQITLQLEDGDVKVVQEKESGLVTKIQGNVLLKQDDNKLVYTKSKTLADLPVSFNSLNIPFGKQFEVVLTDGTRIILNAGSKLRYPTFFPEGKSRNVYLDGEAFFVVSEDSIRPFIVHTQKMKIRVLGTEFNVSAYKKDEKTTAVLASGKIAAFPASLEFKEATASILSPGEMASLNDDEIIISKVNVEKYTAWTSGKLMFINDSFEIIAKKLERHFDVEIVNNCSELKESNFTGTFEAEEIDKILKTFEIHTPFDYKKAGNKIIISDCK